MISFKIWAEINEDRLLDEYEEYLEKLDKSIIVPLDYDDFVMNRYEDAISDFENMKYEEFKDER